jgi:hypothetical protein
VADTLAPTSESTHPLSAFWQLHVFSLGGIDFLQIDVALAAMVFGEWARFERRLTEGLACVARASAENLSLPQDAIDENAIAFRYERNLISGAEITEWLTRAGISADAWMAFITRGVLRESWRDDIEDVLDRYSPSPRQLEDAALAEGICSGLFDEFEESFSGKAATAYDMDAAPFQSRALMSVSHGDAATRLARQHAPWLEGRTGFDTLARLRALLEIKDLYCAATEKLVAEAALLEVIEANRLEWVVIDTDTLSFADESAAREALLCVSEDRLSLADVGALARHRVIRTHGFLDDVLPEHRHRLLAAEPGCVVGPLSVDGRFHVTTVTNRAAPTLDDEHVAERARTALLEQTARRTAREHVKRRRPA